MANHEDPLEFKSKDEAHVRDKTIPKRLKRFLDLEEGEKLQDFDMVSTSHVTDKRYNLGTTITSNHQQIMTKSKKDPLFIYFAFLQFFLPVCIGRHVQQKEKPMGHYFVVTINMKKECFELLDSLQDEYSGTTDYFNTVTSRVKRIWEQISPLLQLSPSNIGHFKKVKMKVPLQGKT